MMIRGLVGLVLAGIVSAQKVKFMPLGDSITEITCWRAYVWDQFSDAGLTDQVDFVGSMTNNPQNCKSKAAGFDTGHEGHSGWLSIDIANNYLRQWLQSTKPDVVQFMLGTNDAAQGRTTDAIIESYTKMVDLVIPLSFNNAPIDALNARIPAWAEGLNSEDSPIQIADCSSKAGFTTGMLRDGVHPNDQGDQLIAKQVGPLVVQAVKDVIAERGA